MGKLQSQPALPRSEQIEAPIITRRLSLSAGTVIGYLLFFLVWALTFPSISTYASIIDALNGYWPGWMMVPGGVLAFMLLIGGINAERLLSMSFAVMSLIVSLTGFFQTLFAMGSPHPYETVSFIIISSCVTALLGIILVGAPLEDRAIRIGRVAAPSAFSRVAWYVFPLVTLLVHLVAIYMVFPLWSRQ
jgi:hypothetical protein